MAISFAIGSPEGPRSSVWKLWRHTNPAKADVFLAARRLAGALKLSFHQSGEIRDAFTREYQVQHTGAPVGRARQVWNRAQFGDNGIIHLYQVCFPVSELRSWDLPPDEARKTLWIPAAEAFDCVYIDLIVTRPGLENLELRNFYPATNGPLAHWYLPTGENFLALPHYSMLPQEGRDRIHEALRKIPFHEIDTRTPQPSLRLNLITAPINGMAITVELAVPCTVSARGPDPDPPSTDSGGLTTA